MWERGHLQKHVMRSLCALCVHMPGVLCMLKAATVTSANSSIFLPHPPPLFSMAKDPQVKHKFLRQGDVSI